MTENTQQIPLGPKHLKCPLWKKPMDQVCHTCPLWTRLAFRDPRNGELSDKWDCGLALLPVLMVDQIKSMNQTTASVDKVANVVAEKPPDNVLYIGENVDGQNHTKIKLIGE